jgi:tetratricopeptide (TPR) repeat protein
MRTILIGLALMLAASPAGAQTSAENATKCMSRDPDVAINGCTALIQANQETTATDLVRAYYNRGNAYRIKRLYDQAIADSTKAIEISPNFEAYNNRGWAYHLKGEDAKGLPDAAKAVGLAPKEAEFVETRAEIYEKLGLRAEAVADYRAALTLDTHHQSAKDGLKRLGATP